MSAEYPAQRHGKIKSVEMGRRIRTEPAGKEIFSVHTRGLLGVTQR